MAVQQQDIARTLRPLTLHAQQVMAQARADVERLPAVLVLVQRALEHAGMADTFRLLPDLDQESAARGAKSYPETSAQHHALWAAIMASMIRKKPLEAERYIDAAEVSAALALQRPSPSRRKRASRACRRPRTAMVDWACCSAAMPRGGARLISPGKS